MMRARNLSAVIAFTLACGGSDGPIPPEPSPSAPVPPATPPSMEILGLGEVRERLTAEVWVHGDFAYTTTYNRRTVAGVTSIGNAIKIWNVSGSTPVLVDSVLVADATTLGDIQVSDDGKVMLVATEIGVGSALVYDVASPTKPKLLARFTNANTAGGVHTAELRSVNGVLHAFLSVINSGSGASLVVILDLSNPASPREVFAQALGPSFSHDIFVRDGIMFASLWNAGTYIFDIGGGGKGGTVANPVRMAIAPNVGGRAHNSWWFHDKSNGAKKYLFVGEEGPGSIGASSEGDVHVLDITDSANPKEVAYLNVPNAGPHNFVMDESRGILYAAYYNAGVRAIDVRGDLAACTTEQRGTVGRCDLAKMGRVRALGLTNAGRSVFVWGVHLAGGVVYASDMLNGLWKLKEAQ